MHDLRAIKISFMPMVAPFHWPTPGSLPKSTEPVGPTQGSATFWPLKVTTGGASGYSGPQMIVRERNLPSNCPCCPMMEAFHEVKLMSLASSRPREQAGSPVPFSAPSNSSRSLNVLGSNKDLYNENLVKSTSESCIQFERKTARIVTVKKASSAATVAK